MNGAIINDTQLMKNKYKKWKNLNKKKNIRKTKTLFKFRSSY